MGNLHGKRNRSLSIFADAKLRTILNQSATTDSTAVEEVAVTDTTVVAEAPAMNATDSIAAALEETNRKLIMKR